MAKKATNGPASVSRKNVAAGLAAVAIAASGYGVGHKTTVANIPSVAAVCPAQTPSVEPTREVEKAVTPACVAALPSAALPGAYTPPSAGLLGVAPTTSFSNGQIPCSALRDVTGGVHSASWACSGMLAPEAAAAWNALSVYVHAKTGAWLQASGPLSSYRSYAGQVLLRNQWCAAGNCGNAAVPGTSNHGWGVANDITPWSQQEVLTYGPQFHWNIRGGCSDAPWEAWHAKYCGGYTGSDPGPYGKGGGGHPVRVLKLGDGGKRVAHLNCQYRHLHRPPHGKQYQHHKTDHFGPGMKRATEHFQKDFKLSPIDGEFGPKSKDKMTKRWHRYEQHHKEACGL